MCTHLDMCAGGETVFPDSEEKPTAEQAAKLSSEFRSAALLCACAVLFACSGRARMRTCMHVHAWRVQEGPVHTPARDLRHAECGRSGVAVQPRKGDCLLFWSLKPDTRTHDPASLHAGCPVCPSGTAPGKNCDKWSATKWIRVSEHKVWD